MTTMLGPDRTQLQRIDSIACWWASEGGCKKVRRETRSSWSYSFNQSIPVWTRERERERGGEMWPMLAAYPIENLISFSSLVIPHITSESGSFPFHAGPIFVMKMKLVSLMSAIFFPFPASWPAIIHFQLAPWFLLCVPRSWEDGFLPSFIRHYICEKVVSVQ